MASAHWRRPGWEVLAAGLLALGLLLVGNASIPLIGRDEPRFAEAAREMLARGELVVPTFGGLDRYDKPILVYWCTVASYAVFGVNEGAARLPSNLAGALVVALVAASGRRRWGPGAGLLAGGLLLATLTFHVQARACTADLVMLLPTTAAMLALERLAAGEGNRLHAAVLWLGLGLSTLAKGPVGPAVAVAAGVALWALGRAWRRWELVALAGVLVLGWWRLGPSVLALPAAAAAVGAVRSGPARAGLARLRWWWGAPLAAAVVVPWTLAAFLATDGAFFRVGVGRHVVARSLTALESHGGFPGFYMVTGLVAALPWFPLLAPALRRFWREGQQRFLLAWLLGPLVLLELVQTKLVHYWLPSYPAGVLLVTGWALTIPRGVPAPGRCVRAGLVAGGLFAAAVPVAVALRLELGGVTAWAAAAAAPLVLAVGWAAVAVGRRPVHSLWALVAGAASFVLILLTAYLPGLAPHLVGPRAAARAVELRRPAEPLLLYKARDDELFFELPLGAVNCRSRDGLAQRLRAGEAFLGVARAADLESFRDEHPGLPVELVELVDGVDLGRVRWTRAALFRPAGGGGGGDGGP